MEPLNVKIDLLATEALVRIRSCLDLITEAGYVDSNLSLKERYFKTLGAYNLNRTEQKMWEMVWNNQIVSLFQMEQDSGIKGIKLIKPSSLEELAVLNSVKRQPPNLVINFEKSREPIKVGCALLYVLTGELLPGKAEDNPVPSHNKWKVQRLSERSRSSVK